MSEDYRKENNETTAKADMTRCRDEIGRLHLEGYSTREIAAKLGGKTLDVARNLREVQKRWQRAAWRQQAILPSRCATIHSEALDAWRRSQQPKVTTTTDCRENKPARVTTRTVEGPGDKGFLTTAFNSFKILSQCAAKNRAEKAAAAPKVHDQELNAILDLMTPDQLEQFEQAKRERRRRAREAAAKRREARAAAAAVSACTSDSTVQPLHESEQSPPPEAAPAIDRSAKH